MYSSVTHRPSWSVSLDAVRGTAALLVVLEHLRLLFFVGYARLPHPSPWLQMGYGLASLGSPAVMVFFVLSGYFISSSIFRMRERNTWGWAIYGVHRLVRLYLVLLPALGIAALWDTLGLRFYGQSAVYLATGDFASFVRIPVAHHESWRIWAGNLFFLQGIICPVFGSNVPLWSLSYEFWYYLLFPVLLLLFARGQSGGRRMVYALLTVGIAALVGRNILMYFAVWLLGSAVAALERRGITLRTGTAGRAGLGALFVFAVAVAHTRRIAFSDYEYSLAISVIFAGWLSAVLSSKRSSPCERPAARLPFALAYGAKFLADRSYTLYLVHAPVLFFLCAVILPQGHLWQPDGRHVLLASGILALVLLYASVVWLATEAHTDRVRVFVETRWLHRNSSTQRTTSRPDVPVLPDLMESE